MVYVPGLIPEIIPGQAAASGVGIGLRVKAYVDIIIHQSVHEESTKSILGMNPGEAPLTVSKDGGAVDAITASTITSRAFLNAVNAAYQAYKAEGGEVNGVTGASQKAKGAEDRKSVV